MLWKSPPIPEEEHELSSRSMRPRRGRYEAQKSRTGRFGDATSGYRFYSASIGRWLSRDPIAEKGGINIYGFCANDPVGKTDRLGSDINVIAAPLTTESISAKAPHIIITGK